MLEPHFCSCVSASVWALISWGGVMCSLPLYLISPHFLSTGASGWLERVLSAGKGWRDSLPEDAQRQLHQSHGRRRQRGLGLQPQTLAQGPGSTSQLPEGHTAIPHRDDHAQVSFCLINQKRSEMHQTRFLSNGLQGVTPLVSEMLFIICKLMRN